MLKKISFLTVAAGLTIIATFIQQFSSYERPVKVSLDINKENYDFELPVVQEENEKYLVVLNIPDSSIHGKVFYKLYNSPESWKENKLTRNHEQLVVSLPQEKANVKVQYYLQLELKGKCFFIAKNKPVIVRYQGLAPKYILFPQFTFMFIALIFACFAGILALFSLDSYKKYSKITFYLFTLAILILGFLVHLISFGHIILNPCMHNDLTFYKNLLIFLLWLGIFQLNKKYNVRILVFLVAIATLLLYCIPQQFVFSWIK